MNDDELEVLSPDKKVTVNGEVVEVKEMSWLNAMNFLTQFAKSAGHFLTTDGRMVLTQETVVTLVIDSKSLADSLIKGSTGKDQAWIDGLGFGDGLTVLERSLELNVRPDFFVRIKAVASRLGSALGIKRKETTAGSASSTSSSGTDTAGKTL